MNRISFFVIIIMTSIASTFAQTGNINRKYFEPALSKSHKAIKQRLDSVTSNTEKILYTYDNVGNVTSEISYRWNEQTNNWSFSAKQEYEYDNNGNIIMMSLYYWSDRENKMIGDTKREFTYNLNYSLSDLTIPREIFYYDYNYSCNNMVTEIKYYSWNSTTNNWDAPRIDTYHYSSNDVAIIEIANDQRLQVYPNPTSDMLFIQSDSSIEQISFYDINGKIVKQIQTSDTSVSIKDLSAGIYILKVKTSAGESTHKVSKK